MRFPAFLCAIASSAGFAATPATADWPAYVNVRYGFSICHPADLVPQGEADNGDGQIFRGADGAELRAFGSNNVLERSPAEEVAELARASAGAQAKVTYRASRRGWGVVSGSDGGETLFYAKTVARDDQLISFQLTYPKASAKHYAVVVQRLSRCFHLTQGHA